MAKTIKDAFPILPKDENDLVEVSDELWKLGNLDRIKEQVSAELFMAHVSMNVIGNWQCDGWGHIVSYQPNLFPYIPQALDILGQPDIKKAFQNVIAILPEFVSLHNGGADTDALYSDMINFLSNVRLPVKDERFNQYDKKERAEISKEFNNRMEVLENLSDPLLKWDGVFNFIKAEYNS